MRITQLLTENTIILDLKARSKREVLDELAGQLDRAGKLNDKKQFTKDILAREEQSTTGIGDTIAIPHAKSEAVKTPAIAFGRSFDGIDFESLDGQPAQLFFMIAATAGANDDHLEALSRLATFLMDEKFRVNILEAESKQQVLDIVSAK
ncbi:MAG: fructose PTS transporter subunit IIA, partial [Planococcus sp. (in: firmicutes)]|nr:fructose PTS transporter subunit IIA [Planococcus sp. (in: firmicutes)]